MRKALSVFAVCSIVIFFDYATKQIVEAYVRPHDIITVLPFLRIVNVKNTGAAFGILSSLNNNIFILITIIAITFIIICMFKIPEKGLELFSLSLILGGAIGNFIDRVTIGKVIDFIDFFGYWPAFNVADSAISIGIVLFLWANIRHIRNREKVQS
ncbi:MAG: signal peptidase II [Nitrospirota bacterium]